MSMVSLTIINDTWLRATLCSKMHRDVAKQVLARVEHGSQDAFVPERWIADAPEAANEAEKRAWMAFGDGAPSAGATTHVTLKACKTLL